VPKYEKDHMPINVSLELAIYREIVARAEAHSVGKATIARQIIERWFRSLPENDKMYGGANG
jgi:hypothetical protein